MADKQNFRSVEDYIDLSSETGLTSIAPTIDIKGKTVVVTGAADGIGRAITEAMVHFGAEKLIVIDRDEEKLATLQEKLGDSVHTINFDLITRDQEQWDTLGDEIACMSNGVVDVAVLNAARSERNMSTVGKCVSNTGVEELHEFFQVNVAANWQLFGRIEPLLTQAALPAILGSTSPGVGRAAPGTAAYPVTKGALEALLQQIGAELDTKLEGKALVAAIDPGRVGTKMRGILYPGEPVNAQPLPVDVIEPYLRLASRTVDVEAYHRKAVVLGNTVAQQVEINGIAYKISERSGNGFISTVSVRDINAAGQRLQPLSGSGHRYDSWCIRQLVGAGPVPKIVMDHSLANAHNIVPVRTLKSRSPTM